jgi:hypothetical protein
MVVPVTGFGRSMESGGRFSIRAFGSNLISDAVKNITIDVLLYKGILYIFCFSSAI